MRRCLSRGRASMGKSVLGRVRAAVPRGPDRSLAARDACERPSATMDDVGLLAPQVRGDRGARTRPASRSAGGLGGVVVLVALASSSVVHAQVTDETEARAIFDAGVRAVAAVVRTAFVSPPVRDPRARPTERRAPRSRGSLRPRNANPASDAPASGKNSVARGRSERFAIAATTPPSAAPFIHSAVKPVTNGCIRMDSRPSVPRAYGSMVPRITMRPHHGQPVGPRPTEAVMQTWGPRPDPRAPLSERSPSDGTLRRAGGAPRTRRGDSRRASPISFGVKARTHALSAS